MKVILKINIECETVALFQYGGPYQTYKIHCENTEITVLKNKTFKL